MPERPTTASPDGPIVFYDGDCGFCALSIQWVRKRDPAGLFRFAPLQGPTAKATIGAPLGSPDAWAIVLWETRGTSERSTAALRILERLPGWGFIAKVGLAVPRPIRDFVYGMIAKVRYQIFGHAKSCPLPSRTERARFLP